MQQQPDELGRIVVSKKIDAIEWERTVKNCDALPGKVKLDKYTENALNHYNDYMENVSPDIDNTSRNKIKLLADDLERALFDLADLKKDLEYKDRINKIVVAENEELKHKKVEEKVQ